MSTEGSSPTPARGGAGEGSRGVAAAALSASFLCWAQDRAAEAALAGDPSLGSGPTGR